MAAALLSAGSAAAAQQPLQPVKSHELLHPDAPISARGVAVGLMADPQAPRLDPTTLYVDLPAGRHAALCVTIVSRDGQYDAELEYRPGTAQGRVALARTTAHAQRQRGYGPMELAIFAHLANRCDEPVETYVVASWGAPLRSGGVLVMVNSSLHSVIVAPPAAPDTSDSETTTCLELREPRVVAFNRLCRLKLRPQPSRVLRLLQFDPPRPPPPIPLPVALP